MNRKASVEWQLETLGKMIFYALVILAIVYMVVQLTEVFVSGEREFRSQRNFKFVMEKTELAMETGKASVIMQLPENYFLLGFDERIPETGGIKFTGAGLQERWLLPDLAIEREECKETCICLYKVSSGLGIPEGNIGIVDVATEQIICEEVDAKHITGTWKEITWRQKDLGADAHPEFIVPGNIFALSAEKPLNLVVNWDPATETLAYSTTAS